MLLRHSPSSPMAGVLLAAAPGNGKSSWSAAVWLPLSLGVKRVLVKHSLGDKSFQEAFLKQARDWAPTSLKFN